MAAALPLLLAAPCAAQRMAHQLGVVDDWSTHHLVFSNPGTIADAMRSGTVERWYKIVNDPRYQNELRRRSMSARPMAATGPHAIKKDWSEALTSAAVAATLTVAISSLSSSDISGSSTLTIDGVTFDASAPTQETASIKFSSSSAPANNSSVTIGSVTYVFETSSISGAPSTGCQVFSASGSAGATSLYQAITYTGTQGSSNYECATSITAANNAVTASLSSSTISLTAAIAGPTGFTFSTSGTTHLTTGSTAGSNGTASSTAFVYWSGNNYVTASQLATNIATAVNANTTVKAVLTATANSPASGDVTFTAKTAGVSGNSSYQVTAGSFSAFSPASAYLSGGAAGVQPNMFPAKYSFNTTGASCSDYVVYPTGAAGASNAANIVAYNNLYSGGCTSGSVPSLSWAYNTGGTVTTSPILSEDGTQVAFMQVSGTTASLVLLKPAATGGGSITAPNTITEALSAAGYRGCTVPCYYTLSIGANDTLSAPFYDYLRDALYVGDDSGYLHQFFGAFAGNPAENTTSPWPVKLGGNKLSSPVYDSEDGFQAGYVFVGDMGGVFYSVGSGYGGTTSGTIYGNTGSLGQAIADAPLVDCPQGVEYVFVTTNGSYSYPGYDAVWEFVSIFTNLPPSGQSDSPGIVPVGKGGTGYYLYAGTFDNVYFQSSPPFFASTGNIYVVGNTGIAGGATLYQVPISWSALTGASNAVASSLNSTEYPWPSPATEFCSGACASPTVSGCTFTTSSTTVTCTSGGFSSGYVGLSIAGTGIPPGATITTYTSPTVVKISEDPSANESSPGVSLTIGVTISGTDYVFFSVNRGTKTGCTNAAGHGCILSYNINNPNSVTQAGSGLDVTTPGTNGCWATGGIVIDNSSNVAGASQIYFANLNGNTAGGPTGPTSGSCTAGLAASVNGVQAAQNSP